MADFTEKELHCIARLIQSAHFGNGNIFDGCNFCKYQCHTEQEISPHFEVITDKLMRLTGVDLSPLKNSLTYSDFPYRKFLRNANEKTREYFRNYFVNV